ncbi:alpha-L-rhamnosidase [Pelagicoccus mobilis]|uniref:alpha-L-rhamnosidase n=1 Tax=Pelagicoccus mobilis TaxID=415221 RepID=A0A934RYV0_9BACT|nr:alpha-L-rhamnosidase [Pelagicoccus mobilis]MBK1876033.1 family 78 glycoside hydrolase catalytic domain [Pelagicoccus mobilis]
MNSNILKECNAEWIRGGWATRTCPMLRRDFCVDKDVVSATLHVTALGVCEPWLNGKKIGDVKLLPGYTDYHKRVYYHSFDVSDVLTVGANTVSALLGQGWFAGHWGFNHQKGYWGRDAWFACVLEMEKEDGSRERLVTDSSWVWKDSPLLKADLLEGETYDAREETPGWSEPGIDLSEWQDVVLINRMETPPDIVEPHPGVPVREIETLSARSVSEPKPGTYVFDMGQNMVGVVRLKVNVPAGTEIVIKHGEMRNADGTVYRENLRTADCIDRFIAKGTGEEIWEPRFTFHGFQFVEIEGLPADCPPSLDTVTGVVWMSDLKETGTFECSDERVNRLFENIRWSFRGNYLEVPTDCPQRDERLGWTGDAQMFVKSATYLGDIRKFFKKWLVDLNDSQREDGAYPEVAPYMGMFNFGVAAWGDAGIVCPYTLWKQYDDLSFVRDNWSEMKMYMEYIVSEGNNHNDRIKYSCGDWLHINSPTPDRLIGLAYRAFDARMMSEMADALGLEGDVAHFEEELQRSRSLFQEELFDGDRMAIRTQTACALAVTMDLVEGEELALVSNTLVELLEESKGYLTCGFVGTGLLCPALSRIGRGDLAVQLLLNDKYPSWLYEVDNGATTIWERWNSWTKEDGFGDIGMNSFNHYAFGAVYEWMMESLAGIRPSSNGFKTVTVEPIFTGKFDFVRASYDSISGKISVAWEKTDDGFTLKVETAVPAEIRLPDRMENVDAGLHEFRVSSEQLMPA